MRPARFRCLFVASFMTLTPFTPDQFLTLAKERISVGEKISALKRLTQVYPDAETTSSARDQLVNLLMSANRYDEALQQYRIKRPEPGAGRAIDFKLLELMLRTGKYNDVLRATAAASGPEADLLRDMKILEIRVQALLAKGLYSIARECVHTWLTQYAAQVAPGTRFESDVHSLQYLERHIKTLERQNGPTGKSLFTASVPHSLQSWSQRPNVPIVFFKLIPARSRGQLGAPLLPGRYEGDVFFEQRVEEINQGFDYVSGGQFSLSFKGVHTLYISEGDMDPQSSGGHLLTSRVYMHTIPQLYQAAGEAFAVLIDYRMTSEAEAAYMGDGLIHVSAARLDPLILMHEILHGLGATHQEWNSLQAMGYHFDPEDRGLMTFDHGEIRDLGLEEKNRAVLGWPQVGVVRPHFASRPEGTQMVEAALDTSVPEDAPPATAFMAAPSSPELIPAL